MKEDYYIINFKINNQLNLPIKIDIFQIDIIKNEGKIKLIDKIDIDISY